MTFAGSYSYGVLRILCGLDFVRRKVQSRKAFTFSSVLLIFLFCKILLCVCPMAMLTPALEGVVSFIL